MWVHIEGRHSREPGGAAQMRSGGSDVYLGSASLSQATQPLKAAECC